MAYDCTDYEWLILENRLKQHFHGEKLSKALEILSFYCGLEYRDLSIITDNIIKKFEKE